MIRPALAAVGLCALGCSPARVWHGRTPDRSRVVEVLQEGKQQFVRVDGVEGPRFDAVPAAALAFSADGKQLAYAARQAAQWMVVANGTRGEAWSGIGPVALSPDGAHLAYAAWADSKWRVVHDGKPGPALDSLFERTLTFSPDGARLAYVGEEGGKSRAVVDGLLGPPLEAIGQLAFSPDGVHLAYVARDEAAAWVVRDGVAGPRYDFVTGLVQGSKDRWGAVVRLGAQRFVVIDGRHGPEHHQAQQLVFSPDGARFAWVAQEADRSRVIVDGVPGPAFERIEASTLAFSGDGRHLVYVGRASGQQRVVRDGAPGPPFARITGLSQAGGDRWGYLGSDGRGTWPVINGQPLPARPWAGDLALSPDGRRYAFLARPAKGFEVVHEAGSEHFDLVVEGSLAFGRDGRRWGCLAGDATRRRLFVAIEGRPPVPFDLDELAGLAADRPDLDPEAVRRWVRAEVERAK